MSNPLLVFVDVDDTLVRSFGPKRIPMPAVVEHVRSLRAAGAALYCWSSGGAEYARATCRELGLESEFLAFLPKPTVIVDDMSPDRWPRLVCIHPNEVHGTSAGDYESALEAGAHTIGRDRAEDPAKLR